MSELLAFVTGSLVTFVLLKPLIALLGRRQVVDVPNSRSSHTEVIPRGGGIAVVIGLVAAFAVAQAPLSLWMVSVGVLAAALLGFVDDLRGLSPFLRLGLLMVLGLVMVAWLLRDTNLPGWLTSVTLAAGVIWLAGYANAFNFMDGINGISAVATTAAGAWYLLLGSGINSSFLEIGGAALGGVAVGFLPWNAPRAKVFLGDVGSYSLGLFIAILALVALLEGVALMAAVVPLLAYLVDTTWTLLRRVWRGDAWYQAHREHVYQRLTDVGLSHLQATTVVAAAIVGMCAAVWFMPAWFAVLPCIGLSLAYVVSPSLANALTD